MARAQSSSFIEPPHLTNHHLKGQKGCACLSADTNTRAAHVLTATGYTPSGQSRGWHFFAFGSFPELSSAEVVQACAYRERGARVVWAGNEGALLEGIEQEEVIGLFHRLGGSVKVANVVPTDDPMGAALGLLVDEHARGSNARLIFGLSVYGDTLSSCTALEHAREWGLSWKRALHRRGVASRLVTARVQPLSSVVVTKNRLLDRGVEIVVVRAFEQWYVGCTLAVQPFEQWGQRDMGRPRRNARRGMLPPKIARIMINLATNPTSNIQHPKLLDPFCGSGTILMEALGLGYRVIGSDMSKQAVEDTRKNLEWIIGHTSSGRVSIFGRDEAIPQRRHAELVSASRSTGIPKPLNQVQGRDDNKWSVFVSDVRHLTNKLSPHSIDAIVTEPDLGPPQTRVLRNEKEIESVRRRLSNLYLQSFEAFAKLLKPGGRVVMSLPVWQLENRESRIENRTKTRDGGEMVYSFDRLQELEQFGFRIVPPLPQRYYSLFSKPYSLSQYYSLFSKPYSLEKRPTLLYGRPDQFVWREIVVLEMER